MKFALLGLGEKSISYTTKKIIEEAKKVFREVQLIPLGDVKLKVDDGIDAFYNKKSLGSYDYIFPRIDSKRAELGYIVTKFLDDMNLVHIFECLEE